MLAEIVVEAVSNPVADVRGIVVTELFIPEAKVVVVAPALVPPQNPAPNPKPSDAASEAPVLIS